MINEATLMEPLFIRQVFQTTKIAVKHLCPQAVLGFEDHVPSSWFGAAGARVEQIRQSRRKRPRKSACIRFVKTLHVEGCALRRVLEEVLERSTAKKRGLGGDPRLKSGRHLLLLLLLQTLHHADRRITYTRKYMYTTREISNSPSTGSALFTMGYAYAHVPEISVSCTEPAGEPWGAGGALRVMIATLEDITRMVPGLENTVLGTCAPLTTTALSR